jgi:hypothetical protein
MITPVRVGPKAPKIPVTIGDKGKVMIPCEANAAGIQRLHESTKVKPKKVTSE